MAVDEPLASWLILFARLLIASVFLTSGVHKAIWYQTAVAEFRRDRIPAIWLTLPGTIGLHVVASVCLILGLRIQEAAVLLAVFTIVATLKVHAYWRLPKNQQLARARTANANLAIIGGLLLLAAVGPGAISLSG